MSAGARGGGLTTITAQELLEMPLPRVPWVVEGILTTGLTVLAGAPKVGKSWLSLLIGLSVSMGEPFWGHETAQGDVLYLCLEDTIARVQKRLQELTDEANDRLHFTNVAGRLDDGLVDELEGFLEEHPETRLVIVDTLQKVRRAAEHNLYAADYDDVGALKNAADRHGIAIVVVHHTRKAASDDVFATISGTHGITGSADSSMVLVRPSRSRGDATLSLTGRDVGDREFRCRLVGCTWELVRETSAEELERRATPTVVTAVADHFGASPLPSWQGTASELLDAIGDGETRPNVLTKLLNQHEGYLLGRSIRYSMRRTASSRVIRLDREGRAGDDGNDTNDDRTIGDDG